MRTCRLLVFSGFAFSLYACGGEAGSASSIIGRAVETALKSDLRSYVMAQESYYLSAGAYMNSASRLTEFADFEPTHNVRIHSINRGTGHAAIAYHDSVPQIVCAVAVGSEPPPLEDEAQVGQPTCKRFSTVLACEHGHAYPALTGFNFCPVHGSRLVMEER